MCYGKQIQARAILSPGFISSGFLGSIVGQPILTEMFSCFPQHLNVNASMGSSNYLVPPVSNNYVAFLTTIIITTQTIIVINKVSGV